MKLLLTIALLATIAVADGTITVYSEQQVTDIDVTTYSSGETEYYNSETGESLYIQELPNLSTPVPTEPSNYYPVYDVRER